jgi:uncharacterized protein (TIGR02217 family)
MPDTSFMDDVIFPVRVSHGTTGGPDWPASIVTLANEEEERNTAWSAPLRRYDAKYGVRTHDELYEILKLYHAAMGRLRGFRLKDWTDYRSGPPLLTPTPLDQTIGTGDGVAAAFQLVKNYLVGAHGHVRTIVKPVADTVRVAVAGVEKTLTTHFTVNAATGVVAFTDGNIPATGQAVTAGFEFHVPVRFDCAMEQVAVRGPIGDIPSIYLKELRRT